MSVGEKGKLLIGAQVLPDEAMRLNNNMDSGTSNQPKGGNNYGNLHFQIAAMPPKHTPSNKWAGAIFQVLEAYEVQPNERGSLMVIDGAHKDTFGPASEATHFAHLMK